MKALSMIIIGLLLIFLSIGVGVYDYYVHYQYNQKIGSYMENAIDMIAPEGMLQQLQLARQGMVNEGLKESDYGAVLFKKPDNSMKFQYQHIDAIIERVEAVESWKNKAYSNMTNSGETLGDVYEAKMTNLRKYIDEGDVRSDWIAKNTWFIKNHIILYFSGGWLEMMLFIMGAIVIWIS